MINTAVASCSGPFHSVFLEDSEEPGMATSHQKRTIHHLLCENINDGELRELNINQIPYVTEDEARIWIDELQNSIW